MPAIHLVQAKVWSEDSEDLESSPPQGATASLSSLDLLEHAEVGLFEALQTFQGRIRLVTVLSQVSDILSYLSVDVEQYMWWDGQ